MKLVLVPNKPVETPPSTSTNVSLLSYAPLRKELQNLGITFVLLGKTTAESLETLKFWKLFFLLWMSSKTSFLTTYQMDFYPFGTSNIM